MKVVRRGGSYCSDNNNVGSFLLLPFLHDPEIENFNPSRTTNCVFGAKKNANAALGRIDYQLNRIFVGLNRSKRICRRVQAFKDLERSNGKRFQTTAQERSVVFDGCPALFALVASECDGLEDALPAFQLARQIVEPFKLDDFTEVPRLLRVFLKSDAFRRILHSVDFFPITEPVNIASPIYSD